MPSAKGGLQHVQNRGLIVRLEAPYLNRTAYRH
jgi:hypothetical protein